MIGYEGARLCRIEKTLGGKASSSLEKAAPPMTLNCAGGDSNETCWQWTVLFDLSIPGWLPSSVDIAEFTETSYSLHAFATLETIDPPTYSGSSLSSFTSTSKSALQRSKSAGKSSPWSLSSLPSLFSSSFSRTKEQKVTATPIPIVVNRVRTPPRSIPEAERAEACSLFPIVHEQGSPLVHVAEEGAPVSSGGIPLDLLGAVDVVASLPEYTDIQEGTVPLGLRVRCLPEYCGGRTLRLLEFEVQVSQVETYWFVVVTPSPVCAFSPVFMCSSTQDRAFQQQFPISSASEQPPTLPLLSPNPLEYLTRNCQIYPATDEDGNQATKATRKHMLIPDGQMYYRPAGVPPLGAMGGVALDHRWARMDVTVPLLRAQSSSRQDVSGQDEEDGKMDLTPEAHADRIRRRGLVLPKTHSPFARVAHEMKIFIKVSWDPNEDDVPDDATTDDERSTDGEGHRIERIHCTFPLHFVRIPDESRARLLSSSLAPPQSLPTAAALPLPGSPSLTVTSCSPLSSLFSLPSSSTSVSTRSSTSLSSAPPAVLPAYAQLFHENGERREDDEDQYGCWLPPYSAEDNAAMAKSNLGTEAIACSATP